MFRVMYLAFVARHVQLWQSAGEFGTIIEAELHEYAMRAKGFETKIERVA